MFPCDWSPIETMMWLRVFNGGGGGEATTVSGVSPLSLTNALAKNIVSLTQYGLCTQASTPTPSSPVDIKCNNGALTMVDDELPVGYRRILGFSMNNNSYWEIPDFKMNGSDTLRFSFEATDACNVIGAYSGSVSGNNYSMYVGTSSNYLRYKNGAYNSSVSYNTRYDVEITPTGSSGMKVDSTWTAQTFATPTNLCIGTTSVTASSAKLKGKMYGNIEVVGRAKFIPCERVSDNALGYYDTVGGAFYEQASGFAGAVSLGYDGSRYQLSVVGTPEVLTVSASGAETQTVTDIPALLSVGDYADEAEIISGGVTHRVGIKVLGGTETWTTDTYGGYRRMVLQEVLNASGDTLLALCSHYASRAADARQQPNSIFIASSGKLVIYVDSTQNISTVEEFNTWVASEYAKGTPAIVIYPLAEETTETVTGHTLHAVEGTNTVTVTAEVSPIRLSVVYKARSE